jgi:hypothetical protein
LDRLLTSRAICFELDLAVDRLPGTKERKSPRCDFLAHGTSQKWMTLNNLDITCLALRGNIEREYDFTRNSGGAG